MNARATPKEIEAQQRWLRETKRTRTNAAQALRDMGYVPYARASAAEMIARADYIAGRIGPTQIEE